MAEKEQGQAFTVDAWAKEHRPRKFSDVVGQDNAVALLKGKIKMGKMPSFMLIIGPSGCGKTTLARLFNRYINCATHSACGKCPSCLHDPDRHPDVNELNAAESRGIDEIRKLISDARFKPRYNIRMVILDEAHQLTPQAQQAFLKPLEDTPKTTMYAICTTDPEKLPTAMLTRATLTIQVRMPTMEQMLPRMNAVLEAEDVKMKPVLVKGCIMASGGHIRSAINMLETAATYMAAEPKLDPEKILVRLGAQASPEAEAIASKLVIALNKGLRKAVVRTIFDIEDPVPTINLALRYNEYALAAATIGGPHKNIWHTPDCKRFLEAFNETIEKPSVAQMTAVQSALVGLRTELVSVSITARSLILARLLVLGKPGGE